MKFVHLALFAAAGLAISACSRAPQETLANVKVPAGVSFATTHGVDLNLSAEASALPASGKGQLDISRADGRLLFRGQLKLEHPVHIKLTVPLHDQTLLATVEGANGVRSTVTMPIVQGAVSYSFR